MRVEDTTPRTDDETVTLTVPSTILPPRSAPAKNHERFSLIRSHRPAGHLEHPLHGQAAGAKESVYAKALCEQLIDQPHCADTAACALPVAHRVQGG